MSRLRGWIGEKATTFRMWLSLDTKVYRRFHGLFIPTKVGTTQIDHLLVSPFGLFVIETKNYKGWIFGSENQPNWTQSLFGENYSFQNPLRQNYKHLLALAECLHVDLEHLHSVIFFVGNCNFKTPMPKNVINSGLSSYIKGFREHVLSIAEIHRIEKAVRTLQSTSTHTNETHVKSLRERHASNTVCPKCGSKLVERIAKTGPSAGFKFLGCDSYPKCRFTKKI